MAGMEMWSRSIPYPEKLSVRHTDKYGNVYNTLPDLAAGGAFLGDQETLSYRSKRGTDDILTEQDLRDAARSQSGYGLTNVPPYDVGHEFYTRKRVIKISHPAVTIHDPDSRVSYQGPLIPDIGYSPPILSEAAYPVIPRLTSNDISLYGNRAVKGCAPTHPSASVATFLGELREQLPQIIGVSLLRDRAHFFKSLGNEYLNVEFGWKPFISDLSKMLSAVQNSSRILAQYERDSGRIVRRRFSFPIKTENSERELWNSSYPYSFIGNTYGEYTVYGPGNTPIIHKLSHRETRYWFKGAFTYYVEKGGSAFNDMVRYEQLANRLLGLRVTPEVLWELAPWSWLADWVGNLGDIISNATLLSQDGLVMRYGYLMRRTYAVDTYTPKHAVFKIGMFGHASAQLSVVQKERARATPFGFGLNVDQFTGRQWAILAALGLSRGGRSSW